MGRDIVTFAKATEVATAIDLVWNRVLSSYENPVGGRHSSRQRRPDSYIRSGASIPIRSRQRASVIRAASTSLSLALVTSSSPSTADTTRHCW